MAAPRDATSDSDGDLPDLGNIFQERTASNTRDPKPGRYKEGLGVQTVRRRKLGQVPALSSNHSRLFKPWHPEDETSKTLPKTRIELRTRRKKAPQHIPGRDELSEEEVTILEDVALDGLSEFQDDSSYEEDSDDSLRRLLAKPTRADRNHKVGDAIKPRGRDRPIITDSEGDPTQKGRRKGGNVARNENGRGPYSTEEDLAGHLSRLRLGPPSSLNPPEPGEAPSQAPPATPPSTPPRKQPSGLVSPTKKMPSIPATPHRPDMDAFWSQEFVDDWNTEHSPQKLFQPGPSKSPSKRSPAKKGAEHRAAKKLFEERKHDTADAFLRELDDTITNGRLAELTAATGGIKIKWTNKLHTTAGRANWKRETVRTTPSDGATATARHCHHASIELAEKVIDVEHRLLNVIAHEFCHLANFMVSGVTNNPHGKEFKTWAAKCSRAFSDRGIEVTTKHTYEIDFKYVWACAICGMEYKRHSKSINPDRHRCGSCKGELAQTKPVPRAGTTSEYQKFMKEHMKTLKKENPTSPQKEIMRLIAAKWSNRAAQQGEASEAPAASLGQVARQLVDLTLEDME